MAQQLSEAQRAWLASSPSMPRTIEVTTLNGSKLTLDVLDRDDQGRIWELASRCGFKGFVLRVRNPATDVEYAAKLAVPGDYVARTPESEAKLTSQLRPAGALFVCHEQVGRCAPPPGMPEATEDLVCFLAPWMTGQTLEQRLAQGAIEPQFTCNVAMEVLKAVNFLQSTGLKHDDLHSGNIMLSPIPAALTLLQPDRAREQVSIIDFGSLKPVEQATRKSRDDWLCFVQILVDLFNGLHANRRVASAYPRFMRRLAQFIEKLVDDDPGRHFAMISHIADEIRGLQRLIESPDSLEEPVFQPFEAISAEHLADDATLLDLFVQSLPWISEVRENKPIILTGPRGCGKSMIFRFLAVRTHLGARARHSDAACVPPFDSFGVYISCATHLQNNLSWLARERGRPAQRAHEISTYFQLVVARELFKSLGFVLVDDSANAIYKIHESGIEQLIRHVGTYFRIPVETPRLSGTNLALHFADDLDRLRVLLHRAMLRGESWPECLPDTFLSDLTRKLSDEIPYFRTNPVVFLLDDYSSNRVQFEIQSILNKIVFERLPHQYFKVSCEKFGFQPLDIDGVTHDESREFTTIDAGSKALSGVSAREASAFLEKLIDRRLKSAKWVGTAQQLIGASDQFESDEELARYIREEASRIGRRYYYFGLTALGRLWSGDTSTILQIVREMFTIGRVEQSTTARISPASQHEAIVAMSRALKGRVEGFHPYGTLLANILEQFGGAVRDVLVKGRENKSGHAYRLYRIEMTKPTATSTIDLLRGVDADTAELARELLRRSIFIELQDSRAKEGVALQTMRWELRRVFNPALGLSLSRDSYLQVKDVDELRTLLTDPAKFADRVRRSYAANPDRDLKTGELFEGE